MTLIESLYTYYLQHRKVTTDSRSDVANALFFALRGVRFDGNQYAADVLQRGALLAVVDDVKVLPPDNPVVAENLRSHGTLPYGLYDNYFYVEDVLTALQQLATYHREQFRVWKRPVPVIGVTGTNGKTTTKELMYAVLNRKYHVAATLGNLNNHIGVPLTLLSVRPEHEVAIVEMGANHPMDIAELCEIAHPDYGLITNVGRAHLQGFGSFEGVIAAKTQLYKYLEKVSGTVFIDAANGWLTPHIERLKTVAYVVDDSVSDTVKQDEPLLRADVSGSVLPEGPYLTVTLQVGTSEPLVVHTQLIGSYNLNNILAATVVGHTFGVSSEQICMAIEAYTPTNMRSQLVDLGYGRFMILDTYNANPTSMQAALDSFNLSQYPHKSMILGDMRELGQASGREHRRILDYLMSPDVTIGDVLLVGAEFTQAFRQLSDAELLQLGQKRSVRCYVDAESLIADENTLRYLAGTVLVKGSRGIHLECVAQRLQTLAQS